jgi:hypothetical protein
MMNDFTVVIIHLRGYIRGIAIEDIGRWFVAGCGLTVVVAWLAHRYQQRIAEWWDTAVDGTSERGNAGTKSA